MNNSTAYLLFRHFVDGILPGHRRRQVAQWMVGKEDREAKDAAFRKIWEQTSAQTDDTDPDEALDRFRELRDRYEEKMAARHLGMRILKYAAALALPVVAGAAAWRMASVHQARVTEQSECYVHYGTTDSLWLSDGTKVLINAGSTVFYPKSFSSFAAKREVYLDGEAHFDVARRAGQPFVVHAGKLSIKVLGTHFNVRAYADDEHITTTLEEGKVEVCDKAASSVLYPDEQLVYNRLSGEMRKRRVDARLHRSWMDGNINFEQETLDKVLAELSRKYNVEFKLDGMVDLQRRYTLNFKSSERIEAVSKVLTKVSGYVAEPCVNHIIIIHGRKGGDSANNNRHKPL